LVSIVVAPALGLAALILPGIFRTDDGWIVLTVLSVVAAAVLLQVIVIIARCLAGTVEEVMMWLEERRTHDTHS
jgi:hypothetical protein